MITARLVGQLVLSLAAVLALMWLAGKVLKGASGTRSAVPLDIVARKQLSRGASVSVVKIGDRAIVLGVTENSVTMLSEASLEEFAAAEAPAAKRTLLGRPAPSTTSGAGADQPAAPLNGTVVGHLESDDAVLSLLQRSKPARPVATGPLEGSILSPNTWRRAADALRERTARRG